MSGDSGERLKGGLNGDAGGLSVRNGGRLDNAEGMVAVFLLISRSRIFSFVDPRGQVYPKEARVKKTARSNRRKMKKELLENEKKRFKQKIEKL